MRYRGGGVGHMVTRSNNSALLQETHSVELDGEEGQLEPPVGPLADEEWIDDPDEGDGFNEEIYGFGLESDHEEDESGGEPNDEGSDDAADDLGAEDGEEPGEDIEGEEGFAPL